MTTVVIIVEVITDTSLSPSFPLPLSLLTLIVYSSSPLGIECLIQLSKSWSIYLNTKCTMSSRHCVSNIRSEMKQSDWSTCYKSIIHLLLVITINNTQ